MLTVDENRWMEEENLDKMDSETKGSNLLCVNKNEDPWEWWK